MPKKERKNVYISNVAVDGTVFQTQVLDWIHLYQMHNLKFELIQIFQVKDIIRPAYVKKQLIDIRKGTKLFTGYLYMFPSRSPLYIVNALIIFCKIFKYLFKYQEVLIFSRALIGKEIGFLQRISPIKLLFYYDARGAGAEENKYNAAKNHDYSLKKYKIIADTYYLEYKTLFAANKIFVVSRVLQKYLQDTYNMYNKKFVYYPCLSDPSKFYFSPHLRKEIRTKLQINDQTKVFIYSGGTGTWHMSERLFSFFIQLLKHDNSFLMLCLSKDQIAVEKILAGLPEVGHKFLSLSVTNEEVNKYLNAADYGFLFRENTIMNNVASPTKFAEYMLCGLPVLISEGIGDYSDYVIKHDLGILINESILNNPEKFDFEYFKAKNFDRMYISDFGKKNFSKNSIINKIITEIKT
jgi:hypothetical protein